MSNHHDRLLSSSLAALLALAAGACGSKSDGAAAVAELEPVGASGVRGKVSFIPVDGSVRVEARVEGLSPGDHGFHIHEYGDCSGPEAMTAGEHFNPDNSEHGAPKAPKHHAGDLGNVAAGSGKLASLDMTLDSFTVDTGPRGILGRSVVVHAGPDDYVSQPSGNSGARIACGVIRATQGATEPVTAQ